MGKEERKVEVCLIIQLETEKAFGCKEWETSDVIWLPKSQIELLEDGGPGDTVEMVVPEWLAIKKGLV